MAVDPDDEKSYEVVLCHLLFSGVQVAGGVALAFYTYTKSESPVWPVVYSVAAVGGTYGAFRSLKKIFWEQTINENEDGSPYSVATGSIIYFGSLYAFSEAWKLDNQLWMPCLAVAASSFYYAISTLQRIPCNTPFMRWCRLLFKGALIVSGTTYLRYFRNHEEELLYGLTFAASLETASAIILSYLKGIVEAEEHIFYSISIIVGMPVAFVYACVIIPYIDYPVASLVFLLAVGCIAENFFGAILELRNRLPEPVFERYCYRTLGPLLLMYGFIFGVYIRNRMGWSSSWIAIPHITGGIYATYKGYRKENQPRDHRLNEDQPCEDQPHEDQPPREDQPQ